MVPQALSEERFVTRPVAHRPVLPRETLELLAPCSGDTAVDATLGTGGHAELLLEAVGPTGRVVGIDRDAGVLAIARDRLARFGETFLPIHGDHHELPALLHARGIESIDRVLFDLGVSSLQLDDPQRGFSFREDGPLDMRMDPGAGPTAAELLATLSEAELREALWRFGEEPRGRAIARAIVREREKRPILRTRHLADVVERAVGPGARRRRIHPATRSFQAVRVLVNGEIVGLGTLIEQAAELLRPGGRLAAISFHSLEDRAVKQALRGLTSRCTCPPGLPVCGCGRRDRVRVLTPKPVRPSAAEIDANPRARSAKLRGAERLP
jgi:16S rRNA (cytosine1402-N4)-methyltransferase